jgi:hypothetical protein
MEVEESGTAWFIGRKSEPLDLNIFFFILQWELEAFLPKICQI